MLCSYEALAMFVCAAGDFSSGCARGSGEESGVRLRTGRLTLRFRCNICHLNRTSRVTDAP